MENLIFEIHQYLYIEYTIAVVVVTELLRYLVSGIDRRIKPRYLTAVLGLLLGVIGWYMYEGIDLWKAIISFSIAIIGYQYFWKPIKEKFLPQLDEKAKS